MNTGNIISGYICAYCGVWISCYGNHNCNNNYSWRTMITPSHPYYTEHCYCRPCSDDGIHHKDKLVEPDHLACCMCGVRRKK